MASCKYKSLVFFSLSSKPIERILLFPLRPDFEVETCRATGIAHPAYWLTAADEGAFDRFDLAQPGINCVKAFTVIDDDRVSESPKPCDAGDPARRNRSDALAGNAFDVDPGVKRRRPESGMAARSKWFDDLASLRRPG